MYDDLRRQINDIADLQWMMVLMGNSMGADALDQTYDALRETFDAIKDGELQADNADVVWQLEDTVNQVVSGARRCTSPFWLEQQAADGQRAWRPGPELGGAAPAADAGPGVPADSGSAGADPGGDRQPAEQPGRHHPGAEGPAPESHR
ncbi:hypothetical protein LAWASA_4352 [Lawsonibacter asaccharolyticus]|nr:hypothetical protein LAWASA_4352 [Lawsonibacter asaccharolyticus]